QDVKPPPDPPLTLELPYVPGVDVQHLRSLRPGRRERPVLVVVVREHKLAYLGGHRREQLIPAAGGHLAIADDLVEQDLDVDLVVRGVHPGRVVDEVGVDQPATQRVLDPRLLGKAQVPALADDLGPKLSRVYPNRVAGPVTSVGLHLPARLDVGADAAVPQQIDRSLQDRRDQLVGRQRRDAWIEPERGGGLWRDRHRLGRPWPYTAARGDQAGVVVGPRGSRLFEQPAALGEAERGIGVRIKENMPMVESSDQLDVGRKQHAVAEYIS